MTLEPQLAPHAVCAWCGAAHVGGAWIADMPESPSGGGPVTYAICETCRAELMALWPPAGEPDAHRREY